MTSMRRGASPLMLVLVLLSAFVLPGCGSPNGGGTVITVLAGWTGAEGAGFKAMLSGFETKYGIQVDYTGTREEDAVLASDLQNGNPPDLAAVATRGELEQFAADGSIKPIDRALDLTRMKNQYASVWRGFMHATGLDHARHYYAILVKETLKSIIWYDPAKFPARDLGLLESPGLTWSKLMSLTKSLGTSPWCMGMADGSRSGWPGTNWIEDIVLHQSGWQVYERWLKGNLSWTSRPIVQAWKTFGQIAALAGGAQSELTTSYGVAGWPMFKSRPSCFLDHEGSYAIAFYEGDNLGHGAYPRPGHDFNFFSFPPLTPASQGLEEVSGDLLAMFHDTPAARELIAYLTTPQAQEAWTRRHASGALSVNKQVPLNLKYYPDPVSLALAKILINANPAKIHFDASNSMPAAMEAAFNNAVMQYLASPTPTHLMVILRDLDKVRTATNQQAPSSG